MAREQVQLQQSGAALQRGAGRSEAGGITQTELAGIVTVAAEERQAQVQVVGVELCGQHAQQAGAALHQQATQQNDGQEEEDVEKSQMECGIYACQRC